MYVLYILDRDNHTSHYTTVSAWQALSGMLAPSDSTLYCRNRHLCLSYQSGKGSSTATSCTWLVDRHPPG